MTEASVLAAAADFIRAADRLAIVSHVNPDADAIGSILGLALGLRRLGKQTYPMLSDPVPDYALFLPGAEEIRHELPADGFDAAIFADRADGAPAASRSPERRARPSWPPNSA